MIARWTNHQIASLFLVIVVSYAEAQLHYWTSQEARPSPKSGTEIVFEEVRRLTWHEPLLEN